MAADPLPILDNIRVAAPCKADWSAMSGDTRVRHCGDCKQNVYDLSELTRAEAESLILAKQGRLCVRYFQRADGTILTANCSVGVWRRVRRVTVAAVVAFIAGLWLIPRRGPESTRRQSVSARMPRAPIPALDGATVMGGFSMRDDPIVKIFESEESLFIESQDGDMLWLLSPEDLDEPEPESPVTPR